MYDPTVYGYVNGNPYYDEKSFVIASRHGVEINTDDELIEFAKRITCNWYKDGTHHSFEGFYLGNYCLDEPKASLTREEYSRLKELQKAAIDEYKRKEEAKCWKLVERYYYADNSIEAVYISKDGEEKTVLERYPCGD